MVELADTVKTRAQQKKFHQPLARLTLGHLVSLGLLTKEEEVEINKFKIRESAFRARLRELDQVTS